MIRGERKWGTEESGGFGRWGGKRMDDCRDVGETIGGPCKERDNLQGPLAAKL